MSSSPSSEEMKEEEGSDCSLQLICFESEKERIAIGIACYLEKKIYNSPIKEIASRFDDFEHLNFSSLETFIKVICKSSPCSLRSLTAAIVYLERWSELQAIALSGMNIWTLFVVSVCVAGKFWDDFHYNNAFYAEVSGFPLGKIDDLEVCFVFQLDWVLMISMEMLEWNLGVLLSQITTESDEY